MSAVSTVALARMTTTTVLSVLPTSSPLDRLSVKDSPIAQWIPTSISLASHSLREKSRSTIQLRILADLMLVVGSL